MDALAQDIAKKVKNRVPVSNEEYLYLLEKNPNAFWGFLITNNPGNINNTLRHELQEPYTELGFYPDKQKLARIIEMILQKGEQSELNEVLSRFELKTEGLTPEFVEAFKLKFSIK